MLKFLAASCGLWFFSQFFISPQMFFFNLLHIFCPEVLPKLAPSSVPFAS